MNHYYISLLIYKIWSLHHAQRGTCIPILTFATFCQLSNFVL